MLVAATLMTETPQATAHDSDDPSTGTFNTSTALSGYLPDKDCTWERNGGSWNFNVTVRIADGSHAPPDSGPVVIPFPSDRFYEGRLYSFIDRIQSAVVTFNSAFNSTHAGGQSFDYFNGSSSYSGDGRVTDSVTVYYYNPTQNGVEDEPGDGGGTRYWQNGTPAAIWVTAARPGGDDECRHEGATNTRIVRAQVYLPQYQYWHTASVRGSWENCQQKTDPSVSYLCSKDHDFQSTAAHEIGHTFGLGHPKDATHGGKSKWAHCDAPNWDKGAGFSPRYRRVDQSVMCPRGKYSTAKRTVAHLHKYDEETIERQLRDQL